MEKIVIEIKGLRSLLVQKNVRKCLLKIGSRIDPRADYPRSKFQSRWTSMDAYVVLTFGKIPGRDFPHGSPSGKLLGRPLLDQGFLVGRWYLVRVPNPLGQVVVGLGLRVLLALVLARVLEPHQLYAVVARAHLVFGLRLVQLLRRPENLADA